MAGVTAADLDHAVVTNGAIVINSPLNTSIYSVIEGNISNCSEADDSNDNSNNNDDNNTGQ